MLMCKYDNMQIPTKVGTGYANEYSFRFDLKIEPAANRRVAQLFMGLQTANCAPSANCRWAHILCKLQTENCEL
jgi:hypothetical protein